MTTLAQLSESLAGHYTVEREIGRGGMATVYLARDERHHRAVALKVLDPELGAVLGVERFLSEIRVTANLQHPNLLPLFDSGEAGGLLFYVMPYVEGETLRHRMDREKQLPVDDAIGIAVAVASALDYAHARGVIHRDLKPENILMQAGQPVIADFGIALAVSNAGGRRVTQTGLSLGTPQYMSPEQATGDRVIDGRSDIYSLAAVLYEMLIGEPPHTGATMQAIIARVLTEQPRSARNARPSVPEHVDAALVRALEKLPADRWTTAREFSDALLGKTVRAPTRHRAAQSSASIRWRKLRDPVVLALVATTAAATVFGGLQWSGAHRRPTDSTLRFPLTLPHGIAFMPTMTQPAIAISPDGRVIAFIARGERGTTQLFTRALDDAGVHPIAGTEDAVTVFFSPDGQWLGFVTAAGAVSKVGVDGKTVLPIATVGTAFGGMSWSVRKEIVSTMKAGRLGVMSETGGSLRQVCRSGSLPGIAYEGLALVAPDGKTVLFSAWSAQSPTTSKIGIASLVTSECRVLDIVGVRPIGFVDGLLFYTTASGAVMAAPFDIDRQRLTGTPSAVLTDVEVHPATGVTHIALALDGTLAYYTGTSPVQLVQADMKGSTRLLADEARPSSYPRFSPDGKKIALTIAAGGQHDIWLYDSPFRTPTRLTTDGSSNERPEWSSDGKRVLYRTARSVRSSLWWRAADLSDREAPLLTDDHVDFYEGVITPDGRGLVYQLDTLGADIMYRQIVGDTTPKPIATTAFIETQMRVSPDGKWIAFVTTESGTDQVVVQPFPGPGARTQVSTSGGAEPVWSRDGRRIFYRDNKNFVVATVTTAPNFTVAARDILFPDVFAHASYHADYDVFPDGQSLLLLKPADDAQVMVVHHWIEEVRGKTRNPGQTGAGKR